MAERTEYRVVGWKPGRGALYRGPYAGATHERHAEAIASRMRRYCTEVRIQTRTVTEAPWVDLGELVEHPHE
jgi:hypothetical protein